MADCTKPGMDSKAIKDYRIIKLWMMCSSLTDLPVAACSLTMYCRNVAGFYSNTYKVWLVLYLNYAESMHRLIMLVCMCRS